jgi:minor extracellular serine protease Vpr
MGQMMREPALRRALGGAALACVLTALTSPVATAGHEAEEGQIYLVTLDGPGVAGYRGSLSTDDFRTAQLLRQEATLTLVAAGEPVYRWTTALNGYAVRLDPRQAALLTHVPGVALVEPDAVRRVAGRLSALNSAPLTSSPLTSSAVTGSPRTRGDGGRGVVIGVVDTGINPDSPVFADSPGLGRLDPSFAGSCPRVEQWTAESCNDKVVAARHFVEGFTADRLRSGASVSPYDDDGHGTQVASIAAGNADVSAREGSESLGRFSGVAPDARLAVYKACWAAPDPSGDGCALSDVVSAVDQAVADGVDVLTVAVTGGPELDTVDLALLGAVEDDVFAATPAGNGLRVAGHAQPWTTTVGSTSGPRRAGRLLLSDGTSLSGVMASRRTVPATTVVEAASAPAPGFTRDQARLCVPGALDAGRAGGRIVVCERGEVARVDKSAAVELADGVGMVLVSDPGQGTAADFHAVPTLHVTAAEGAELRRRLAAPGRLRASLERVAPERGRPRLTAWSSPGSLGFSTVKPDLVAPGSGLLSATSPAGTGRRWDLLSGTSASTAVVAGLAARARSVHPRWPASWVRSVLITGADGVAGDPSSLRQGAGRTDAGSSFRSSLVYAVAPGAFRRVLDGRLDAAELNLPSALAGRARSITVVRHLTNAGSRAMYYSSLASGFAAHQVAVVPAAIRFAPGQTRAYRVTVTTRGGVHTRGDSGWVTWRGADGTRIRIPFVVR